MAKTLEETGGKVSREFRTKEEAQKSYRPRFDAQKGATVDATRDYTTLLAAKGNIAKQEYEVDAGIAKRMASDHLMSMNEEINFMNQNMKPGDSRDAAIQRLQSSIASTSGVAAGLTGDAAMAYDTAYINSARKMSTDAMTAWKGEQDEIDRSVLARDFDSFLDTATEMDGEVAGGLLQIWKGRLAPHTKDGDAGVEKAAATVVAQKLLTDASVDPTLTANERAERLRGTNFMGLAEVTEDGVVKYLTDNVEANFIIAKALGPIMQSAVDESAKIMASISKDKLATGKAMMTNIEKMHTNLAERLKTTTDKDEAVVIKKRMAELQGRMAKAEGMYGSGITGVGASFFNTLDQTESFGGDYTALNKKSGAYGRYQFMPDTLAEYAKKTGQTIEEAKTPDGQDIMAKQWFEDNATHITKKGYPTSDMNMWIAHNQGRGGFNAIVAGGKMTDRIRKNMAANMEKDKETGKLIHPATKENFIREWSKKFTGAGVMQTDADYDSDSVSLDISRTGLLKLKAHHARNSQDDKQTGISTKAMDSTMKETHDKLMDKAKASGDFTKVRESMKEMNDQYMQTTGKNYFHSTDVMDVDNEEKKYDTAFDEKFLKDVLFEAIDADVETAGLTVKAAFKKNMSTYADKVKGMAYSNVAQTMKNRMSVMETKEASGAYLQKDERTTIHQSKFPTAENINNTQMNLKNIKNFDEFTAATQRVNDFLKSGDYQLQLTKDDPVGSTRIDMSKLKDGEKSTYFTREAGKMKVIYDKSSDPQEGVAKNAQKMMMDILDSKGDNQLDSRVLSEFIKEHIDPQIKDHRSFYNTYKNNPAFLRHPTVNAAMSAGQGKKAVQYSAMMVVSKAAKFAGKDNIFATEDEASAFKLILDKLNTSDVMELYEEDPSYMELKANWQKIPGVRFEDRTQVLQVAAALVASGNGALLPSVVSEVLGKYQKVDFAGNLPTAEKGGFWRDTFPKHESKMEKENGGNKLFVSTNSLDVTYYSDQKLLNDISTKSEEDIVAIALQVISDKVMGEEDGKKIEMGLDKAEEYLEDIKNGGISFTYDKYTGRYSMVLTDSDNSMTNSRFEYVPGAYKVHSSGRVVKDTRIK